MNPDYVSTMPFSTLMGVAITHAEADEIRGELVVREDLCTLGNILHGGAIMAFADALGAIGGFLSLPEGAVGTTTVESKTNFLSAARQGSTVYAVTTPVKRGKRMSVWQTEIIDDNQRKIALVIQTRMALKVPVDKTVLSR